MSSTRSVLCLLAITLCLKVVVSQRLVHTIRDLDDARNQARSWSSSHPSQTGSNWMECLGRRTTLLGGLVPGPTTGSLWWKKVTRGPTIQPTYSRTYYNLPRHYKVDISFTLYALHTVDGCPHDDRAIIHINGRQAFSHCDMRSHEGREKCVTSYSNWPNTDGGDRVETFTVRDIPHQEGYLTFAFTNRVYESLDNEAYGLSHLTIHFYDGLDECASISGLSCASCHNTAQLYGGRCICKSGAVAYSSSPVQCRGVCPSCGSCGDTDECTGCPENSFAKDTKTCQCNDTFYQSSTSPLVCSKCHGSCLTCSGEGAQNCLTCAGNATLVANKDGVNECQCTNGTYAKSTNPLVCEKLVCDSTCAECSGPAANQCTTCPKGSELQNGTCVKVTCDSTCAECTGRTASDCTKCYKGFGLQNGTCVKQACHESCKECSGPNANDCTACFKRFELTNVTGGSTCACAKGYKPTAANQNKCEKIKCAAASCKKCSSTEPGTCMQCRDKATLNDNGECECLPPNKEWSLNPYECDVSYQGFSEHARSLKRKLLSLFHLKRYI